MKKIVYFALTVFMMSWVSCVGAQEGEKKNSDDVISYEESNQTETTTIQEDTEDKFINTAQIPGRYIYFDYDASFKKVTEVSTVLLYRDYDSLVGVSFKIDEVYTGSLEEVIDLFKFGFVVDASTASSGWLYGAEIEVLTTETVEIAGRESIKFTGKVLNDEAWECHVYGYTFVIDETPCAVIGLVSAKDQDEEMIKAIDAQVDEIASTIRTAE